MKTIAYKLIKLLWRYITTEQYWPGHFYSAIPSKNDIRYVHSEANSSFSSLSGIQINHEHQLSLLKHFAALHAENEFPPKNQPQRYNINNTSFSYDDGPILHFMLRSIQPKNVIEIGSGNSSVCMLDTDEHYLNHKINFTFIDPDCRRLKKNLLPKDLQSDHIKILEQPLQETDLNIFRQLESNDLLFIDSTHVIKAGSDLSIIFFKILPLLKKGVYIHFHDIRFPFEYSPILLNNGTYWNEAYLLRSFLQYNSAFQVVFWLNYLLNQEYEEIDYSFLPIKEWDTKFNNSKGDYRQAGGSIYIQKVL